MMKAIIHATLLLTILVSAAWGAAPDLSKIDRSIRKEPTYQTQPRYCLMVFDPRLERNHVLQNILRTSRR